MLRSRVLGAIFILALLTGGETGCLFHTRAVETTTSTAKLQTATRQQLVDIINTEARKDQDPERYRQHCYFGGR